MGIKKSSTVFILLSVILAIICGIVVPHIFPSIEFMGAVFISLLKLFALPLICSALIATLGDMGNSLAKLKSLAAKTVSYMLISEVIAVTIAIILFNTLKPGVGADPSIITHGINYSPSAKPQELNFGNFILSIIPQNIFASLAKFDLLPVVIFSIMFGVGCAFTGDKCKPLVNLFVQVRDVASTCLHKVMYLAPFGIFSLVGAGVAQSHLSGNLLSSFISLGNFVLVLCCGLFLHALWQLLAVVLLTKQNPFTVLATSIPVFSTAFGTSSSVATLPVAMEVADQLKAKTQVTRFMLPLVASINIGGMMMYEIAAALFFSQMLGVHLSVSQQIILAIACIMGGMAEGGIPETSMVSMVIVFRIVNVPLSAISILLPLDRIIDRIRTMVNVFGNMCGVIIVSNVGRKNQADITTNDSTPSV